MTDKQIIIDGIDVSGCEAYKKRHCKDKTSIMFCKTNLCSNFPNCYYKQLKAKEQECEELKKIIDEAKNSKLDLKSFLVGEAVQNEYEQQLDQLKAENEELKQQIKEIKNVLSISYDLWMYHIANGIGNSDNKNAIEALEDFSVAIRLLADTLGESEGYLSYSTNESKIYEQRKELLQKMNEAQL